MSRSIQPCGAPVPASLPAFVRVGPDGPLLGAGLAAGSGAMAHRSVDVVVCRGCCCGTRRKHPSCDHDGQLDAIRVAVAGIAGARLWVTGCLDHCRHSNLVGIRDWRRQSEAVMWLGGMLTACDTVAVVRYLGSGGELSPVLRQRLVRLERPFPQDPEAQRRWGSDSLG